MSEEGKKYPRYLVEVPEEVRPVVETPKPAGRPLEFTEEELPLESYEKPTETERKVLMEETPKVSVRRRK